jgi:hypothetical protein
MPDEEPTLEYGRPERKQVITWPAGRQEVLPLGVPRG